MKKLAFLLTGLAMSAGALAQTTVKGVVLDSSDAPVNYWTEE